MAQHLGHRRLGKLASLGWLLLTYGAQIEADFQQFFGVALTTCSVRRTWVLVNQLPRESRLVRALAPAAEWGPTEHLIADVVEAIQLNTFVLATVNSKKGAGPKALKPLARPGMSAPQDTAAKGAQALRTLLG